MSLSETLPPAAPTAAGDAPILPVEHPAGAVAPRWVVVVAALVAAGGVGLLFASRFRELYEVWDFDDNYSHGFLVPVVSAWLAWEVFRRQGLPEDGSLRAGLVWVVLGCVLHLWALVIWWPPADFLALATLLYGLAVLAGGRRWAPGFVFPILFLFFMFPLPPALLDLAAGWLQEVVAAAGTWLLQLFIPAHQDGATIRLPGQPLAVGEECSGLRQVVAFGALALLVAYLSKRGLPFRLGIVLAGVPIAVVANLLRVVLMAFLVMHFGLESISEKKTIAWGISYHTAWGLLTMAAGLGLLMAVAWWLGRVFPNRPRVAAPAAGPAGGGTTAPPLATDKGQAPPPVVLSRALVGRLGGAVICLAAAVPVQWALQAHLEEAEGIVGATQQLHKPLGAEGDKGFPVSLRPWSGKEATPDPATVSYFNKADDALSRAYVLDDDSPQRGLSCALTMVHFRNGEDRRHHPLICYKVAGCTERPSGRAELPLEGEGAPARRFSFTRQDDGRYASYVYYWHYTLEPPDELGLSALQRLHEERAVRRPSLTVQVYTAAQAPDQLGRVEEFVRRVDRELQAHLPPGARRGSDVVPVKEVGKYIGAPRRGTRP